MHNIASCMIVGLSQESNKKSFSHSRISSMTVPLSFRQMAASEKRICHANPATLSFKFDVSIKQLMYGPSRFTDMHRSY
jgi:hypothetical protein